ncbi:MAG: hypothetical protein SPI30_03475 [Prevotella sp.]|nr:hypothetical protein [Prevotella sp.]
MLQKITLFFIALLLYSCSPEDNIITNIDSFDIDIRKGEDIIDYMEIKAVATLSHDVDIIYAGNKYRNYLITTNIKSLMKYSLSDYANNIEIVFNAINKADYTRNIDMDIHFINSQNDSKTTRKIKKTISPKTSITFKCKYR